MRALIQEIDRINPIKLTGRVVSVSGMLIEASGPMSVWSVGARVQIERVNADDLLCEVVGFKAGNALLLPYGGLDGVRPGAPIETQSIDGRVYPTDVWLGRVINAFADPIDGAGPLPTGDVGCPLVQTPPPAHTRGRVGERLDMGVRTIDVFTTCCLGQRMGIWAYVGLLHEGNGDIEIVATNNVSDDTVKALDQN